MKRLIDKRRRRRTRKLRVRKKIVGTPERPRLTVYKSNRYLYVQVVDDTRGHTLAAVSNLEKDLRSVRGVTAEAGKLGEMIGQRLGTRKIDTVVFDRNGYSYHGVIKAIADGARKTGIKF